MGFAIPARKSPNLYIALQHRDNQRFRLCRHLAMRRTTNRDALVGCGRQHDH